ncbi:MAG TPA: Druantia anti-phage system protein DruA [Ktedonobacterales bacterium]|jgi:hypothetical protein
MKQLTTLSREELRSRIVTSLEDQGFTIQNNQIVVNDALSKETIRQLHKIAVEHKIEEARRNLARYEPWLIQRIANGVDVRPEEIVPKLVEVKPDTEDELLFRYARLHWSIPVSSGYGRRLRFLVMDESNSKLIGVLGLSDPIFRLRGRDQWVGWAADQIADKLHYVMDAFVLGAVPPYSQLLCGKLIAMIATSDEVRQAFQRRYSQRTSIIRAREIEGELALLTTTSALGRSSLYNRLAYEGRSLFEHCGYTLGSGEFHFSNGLYSAISDFVQVYCTPTAKQDQWGKGFRNRREVIRKCLKELNLPRDLLYHGVRREIFAVPLAKNTREFLRGEEPALRPFCQSVQELFLWFRDRWLLPRADRNSSFRAFQNSSYALWAETGG